MSSSLVLSLTWTATIGCFFFQECPKVKLTGLKYIPGTTDHVQTCHYNSLKNLQHSVNSLPRTYVANNKTAFKNTRLTPCNFCLSIPCTLWTGSMTLAPQTHTLTYITLDRKARKFSCQKWSDKECQKGKTGEMLVYICEPLAGKKNSIKRQWLPLAHAQGKEHHFFNYISLGSEQVSSPLKRN